MRRTAAASYRSCLSRVCSLVIGPTSVLYSHHTNTLFTLLISRALLTGIQVNLESGKLKPSALEGTPKLIYDRFHETIGARDLEGLMQIYADDAILDSSLVLVLEKDPSGIIQGKKRLRAHFQGFFDAVVPSGKEWFRPDTVLSDGQRLMWEYPSQGPDGDQLDVVESFDLDLEKGLIKYHRVYWGRVGHKLLTTAFK